MQTEVVNGVTFEYEFMDCVTVHWKGNDGTVFYEDTLHIPKADFDALTEESKRQYVITSYNNFKSYIENPNGK